MVHDPRVTTLLSRLGGLYRDPSRVDRDASSVLKSSVGVHLTPGIAPLVENNGDSSHCLVLQGTIAIVFRGMTYQLLVDIYLPPKYPIRPPVSYVRLAPNMYLKENHPHVGSDGMVYMPYTHEWNARTHSLIEMVVAMSSVFSADPPVFTRSTPAPAPLSSSPQPPTYVATGFGQSSSTPNADDRQQLEAMMVKEAEEANQAAEVARKAAREEAERNAQIKAQKAFDEKKRLLEQTKREAQMKAQKAFDEKKKVQVKVQVNKKVHAHLTQLAIDARESVQSDWRDEQQLKLSKEALAKDLENLKKTKSDLEQHLTTVDKKTIEIEEWLKETKSSKQDTEGSVDDLVRPVSRLHAQMLDFSAENAALTDALYFIDRGMYSGQIDCTTHLKAVRKLAKRQFLIRAHLIKINQVILKNGGR